MTSAGTSSPTVLVTFFEPFDHHDVNASATVAGLLELPHVHLVTQELAVRYDAGPALACRRITEYHPDLVVCLGEAGGADKVRIERVAINLQDSTVPDNAGILARDRPIDPDGPAAIFTTLPVHAMAEAARVYAPSEVSLSAGSFVCNSVFYAVLKASAGAPPAAFIHVPRLDEAHRFDPRELAAAVSAAISEAIRAALDGDRAGRGA